MKKRRIILNNDFYNIFQVEPPVTDRDIHAAVDRVAGSQVDTLALMVPSTLGPGSDPKQLIHPDLVRLYSHPKTDPCINTLTEVYAAGRDPYRMVLDRARERGMEFFASFRMNDTHYLDQIYNPWVPFFYYDNLGNRIGAPNGRLNTEFDYRKSVIREHMLGIILEAAGRYEVDGVELDCTRNGRFFPAGDVGQGSAAECAPVMTDFIRQVREGLDAIGQKRGRRILISVVIPYSLYGARGEGLDLPAWARLGLIDIVCMSTPFLAELDRDIADTRLKLPGVQVYGGCDRNLDWPGRVVPMEAYRGMAAAYYRQGADGVYLYNVMDWTMDLSRLPAMLKIAGGQAPTCADAQLMHELGDAATLEHRDKLYLASRGAPGADRPFATVPVRVPAGGEVTLRLYVGDDVAAAARASRIRSIELQTISSDCASYNNYTLRLNAVDLARQYAFQPYAEKPECVLLFPEPNRRQALPAPEYVRRHPVRVVDLQTGVNFITIKSYRDPLTITDVELAIRYR